MDRWVGVPYDIPIFIMQYRKDIYDKMGFPGGTPRAPGLEICKLP